MNLKQLRSAKGVSQKDVSAGLGCSPTVYSRYETGEREPSLKMLVRIAEYYGVTTDCVLGLEPVPRMPLNSYEEQMIVATRNADGRAKEDALSVLLAHPIKAEG